MASNTRRAPPPITDRSNSTDSVNGPRTPRFAEATSVNSPVEPAAANRPFALLKGPAKSNHLRAEAQPSDVGFGYINDPHRSVQQEPGVEMPATPKSPLKSALKSPGAPPRNIENPLSPTFKGNPLSPTWKEEAILEKREALTEKKQADDLKIKTRVRVAKMFLRGTNFSCSLIVLAMLASTFQIFNATFNLPPRNGVTAWAADTTMWPQIVLITVACISLFMSTVIFWGYARGGHNRAEKVAVYYTVFSMGFFLFSILIWAIGAGLLKGNEKKSKGEDLWGWSCKNNNRKKIFQDVVNYDIVCRFQNWTLVCAIIEIIVEIIAIIIYGVVFYRYYTKRRLHKTMVTRDRARSDLYLAQLRSQSAPPTPGGPLSPRGAAAEGAYNPLFSPRFATAAANEKNPPSATTTEGDDSDAYSVAESGQAESVQYVSAKPAAPKPFTLNRPPPSKSPKAPQTRNFSTPATQLPSLHGQPAPRSVSDQQPPMSPTYVEPLHSPAAPGERVYDAVPIPGAYASPVASPTFAPATLRGAPVGGQQRQQGDYFQSMR